jgi:DNA-binding beta-propeller fold protein YncE
LGLELTHDNRELLVADYRDVAVLDVGKAETGAQGAVLGYLPTSANASTIEIVLSPDERYAFASNENLNTVSMFDFQRVRAGDLSTGTLLRQIPSGQAPVGLAVSPDNRYLYITSEVDQSVTAVTGSLACPQYEAGSLRVVDLTRVQNNPAHGVVALVAAGCSPVRVLLSVAGDIAWVTARGSHEVLAFRAAQLLTNPGQALISAVDTHGAEPVGLALVKHETELIVANSARFSDPNASQTLSVLDARQALQNQSKLLAKINVGAFPRELFLEGDGQTLLLTNYNSDTISIIDVAKLPAPAYVYGARG